MKIILEIIVLIMIFFIFLMVYSNYSDNKYFCKIMGWHKAPKKENNESLISTGICPRCEEKVYQDSQGNWFN